MNQITLEQPGKYSRTETCCRSCGSGALEAFLDLGSTPLADRLLTEKMLTEEELTFPLVVAFCKDCSLVQMLETVSPEILFADAYPYYSSFSPALMEHSRKNALARIKDRDLGSDSLVIELASNDGYLLRNYVEKGIPVLGIDPADGPAAAARKVGVKTICGFFTEEMAADVAEAEGQADVVHGNNVLAHVADTNGFVAGIGKILKPTGVAVIEMPYLLPLIEHIEFDTIYHEHLCYFSLTALDKLFRRHGLYLNRVEELSIHGGSLRIFVERQENVGESVSTMLANESAIGLDTPEFFAEFSERVDGLRSKLLALISDLKAEGHSVAAYGAAAKGATMLNYCGLDTTQIDFVVDRNAHKQGKYMPGAHLPILPPEALVEKQPDYVLMLAWNFADEIIAQQQDYLAAGGRFIVPVPEPRIVE
ncbi:Methyltransferase domain-containing protein [Altererythrobacter xiamenensis]|uniref:Methyltransferase domain-containing protein n=1 Tax=Altererythrobacter xiamenensis TaxID=1316679 RepID=A0A1Y6EJ67_9SPHN|nr:class I SAM-dependent methyltransferase [Altererythrobacter xiamenensis]SMQ61000.1 Methyltransferase domain-containing protein [Altererythrobacter xiamenensis]